MNGYNGPTLPMNKPPRKVRVNKGAAGTLVLVLAIAVLLVLIIRDMRGRNDPVPTQITDLYGGTVNYTGSSSAPAVQRNKRPESDDPELLPVFYSADTDNREVAITVQNFGSAGNIDTLLELCDAYGAHITFFPTGKELISYPNMWGAVIFGGHEIENHGYSGDSLSSMGYEGRVDEIDEFTRLIRLYVGEEYKPHFLRTNDLSDDSNAAVHAILMERNYLGIARWSLMAPASIDEILPGQIMCIDLSQYGAARLGNVMSVLAENGWQMKTLNEMFEYEPNLLSAEGEIEG